MNGRKSVTAAVIASLLAGAVAWACGPMFPNQLLDDRGATLKAVPQNTFAFEVARLLPATDKLLAVEADPYDYSEKPNAATMPDLTKEQAKRVDTLRDSETGAIAIENGKDLPDDVRWYVAGAIDYSRSNAACTDEDLSSPNDDAEEAMKHARAAARHACRDPNGDAMDQALANFQKVTALPADQSVLRGVWAAYMLGEAHSQLAYNAVGTPAFAGERDAAAKAFAEARTRAVAGGSDNEGLAVASFGEEARLWLLGSDGHYCDWSALNSGSGCIAAVKPADLKHAIALYAAQAGHGSYGAVQSLSVIAEAVLHAPEQVAAIVDGPVSQRLLVAYALARVDARVDGKPDDRLADLVAAIEKVGLDKVAAADRLAALAYQTGRYDLAAKLTAKAPGPLASWVNAKLALQKGDLAAAAAAYADAARAFPKADDPKASLAPASAHLLTGEQGVLALARGEYVEAMNHMFDAATAVGGNGNVYDDYGSGVGYGNDMAFIGERVLTVDELKSFVDARVPASPVVKPDPSDKEAAYRPIPLNDRLRWLLARRLVRAGQFDEALAYFPEGKDERYADVDLRETVRDYAKDLHDGDHAWTDIGKAEARYKAAVIARGYGMEIMGYEQSPDYTDNGGGLQCGSGQSGASMKGPYVTEGERTRFNDSVARPDLRFHYRYIAADKANASADLLPPRSQAFAAVMCKATGWMQDGPASYMPDPEDCTPVVVSEREKRIGQYYDRYVKQGPYVDWAEDFGRNCEEPDFDRARQMVKAQRIAAVKHFIRRNLPYEIGAFVLVLALAGVLIVRRRRKA
ncbi:hypothetical protein FHW69_003593 [Luteibacter sp. Sphag1AF]|uniref:hypothetical protein n=1 Tax=Luteibacter sp. Sphag1AF TaxID=2587031 RepID=UPI0016224024|nr:hypothetical protein [Luteibacter sp. Sphag1AF]MBB3228945.1 hypothetical protein [Luteibacter sp. Sphag1AF]